MENIFINREKELEFLEKKYKENSAQLIILYGRRRIGKTFLIKKFIENKKAIYFLSTKEKEEVQAKEMSKLIGKFFNDAALIINPFSTYSQIFEYLSNKSKERIVFVIDEFGYMLSSSPHIASVLQKFWDEHLSKTKIFIILSGSTISLMESLVSQRNPLYGRRTGQWKLDAFKFSDLRKLLKEKDIEDVMKCWFVTNGIFFYSKEFKNFKNFNDFLLNTFFNKGHIFYEEGRVLISDELGEVPTYFSILSAVAKGKLRQVEIANEIGIKPTSLTRYLENLLRLNFVRKEIPITEKEKSKKTFYKFNDNFLHFWFKFVYPNKSLVEEGKIEEIKKILTNELNTFFGEKFEELIRKNIRAFVSFEVEKVGRVWGYYRDKKTNERKTYEIDIVALNEKTKEILFAECKWEDEVNAEKILFELKRKAELVNWNRGKRKEYYAIFAKSFKEKIEEPGLKLFDLNSLEKLLV